MNFGKKIAGTGAGCGCRSLSGGRFLPDLDPVKSRGIRTEEFGAVCRRELLGVIGHQSKDSLVAASQEADRPIRAEHQAVLAKRLKGDVQIWPEIRWLPTGPIRFGDHAGNLAENIGALGKLANLFPPR